MASYDNPQANAMVFPLFDFGGGATETYSFRGPPGKQGEIKSIGTMVTEVFAVDLTVGKFQIGTAADADAFASLEIADAVADNDFWDQTDDTDAIIVAAIPADTLVRVTLVNGTDGTAVTGQGIPVLYVDWF